MSYSSFAVNTLEELEDIPTLARRIGSTRGTYTLTWCGKHELRQEFDAKKLDAMLAVEAYIQKLPSEQPPAYVWEVTCLKYVSHMTGGHWVHHRVGLFEDPGNAGAKFDQLQEECAKEPLLYKNPRVERVKITPRRPK